MAVGRAQENAQMGLSAAWMGGSGLTGWSFVIGSSVTGVWVAQASPTEKM